VFFSHEPAFAGRQVHEYFYLFFSLIFSLYSIFSNLKSIFYSLFSFVLAIDSSNFVSFPQ